METKTKIIQEDKTHWKKNFNYDYLGAYSLNENQEVTLTIKNVRKILVTGANGQKDACTVAYFNEAVNGENKPMILNKTNCKIIEKLYNTPFIENWRGKQITIFTQQNIKAFGDYVDALRVKQILPKSSKVELNPKSNLWGKAKQALANGATFESLNKNYIITKENFDLLCS